MPANALKLRVEFVDADGALERPVLHLIEKRGNSAEPAFMQQQRPARPANEDEIWRMQQQSQRGCTLS